VGSNLSEQVVIEFDTYLLEDRRSNLEQDVDNLGSEVLLQLNEGVLSVAFLGQPLDQGPGSTLSDADAAAPAEGAASPHQRKQLLSVADLSVGQHEQVPRLSRNQLLF
jgi:hypothetical protein